MGTDGGTDGGMDGGTAGEHRDGTVKWCQENHTPGWRDGRWVEGEERWEEGEMKSG